MKPVEPKQGGSGSSRYTVFTISDQSFALEISFIKEVMDVITLIVRVAKVKEEKKDIENFASGQEKTSNRK